MRKIFLFIVILFWWCLMFPSSSYTAYNHAPSKDSYSIMINDKKIEFKFFNFLCK